MSVLLLYTESMFSRQKLNIVNEISPARLLRKKKTTTNCVFFPINQESRNFLLKEQQAFTTDSRVEKPQFSRSSGIVREDSVSLTNDHPSSNIHDGLGIIEFFCKKKLLITGATGFLAKSMFSIF